MFGTGRPTNFKLGTLMEYDHLHHQCARRPPSNLKPLGGCSSHHFQEAGMDFGGRIADRTAYDLLSSGGFYLHI